MYLTSCLVLSCLVLSVYNTPGGVKRSGLGAHACCVISHVLRLNYSLTNAALCPIVILSSFIFKKILLSVSS